MRGTQKVGDLVRINKTKRRRRRGNQKDIRRRRRNHHCGGEEGEDVEESSLIMDKRWILTAGRFGNFDFREPVAFLLPTVSGSTIKKEFSWMNLRGDERRIGCQNVLNRNWNNANCTCAWVIRHSGRARQTRSDHKEVDWIFRKTFDV